MGSALYTPKPEQMISAKISEFVCTELSKLPSYGSLSEADVKGRGYHAWRGDSGRFTVKKYINN